LQCFFATPQQTGERIIYAEGLDTAGAMDLFGTHLVDFSVGKAFWNDGEHMHSDILAPATQNYLPQLFANFSLYTGN